MLIPESGYPFRYTELITEPHSKGGIAHTRGRRAFKPTPGNTIPPEKLYLGKDVNPSDLVKHMEQGVKDVLDDAKYFHLQLIRLSEGNGFVDSDDSEEDEADNDVRSEFDGVFVEQSDDINEEDIVDPVATPMGVFNRRTAEAFYLNGGRSTTKAKGREKRFYYNQFDKQPLEEYKHSMRCSSNGCFGAELLGQGDFVTLGKWVGAGSCTGRVAYMTVDQKPLQRLCRAHLTKRAIVWLRTPDCVFVRCIVKKTNKPSQYCCIQ